MNCELWRLPLKEKPWAQVLRRFSGNGRGLCTGLECVYKLRGGSREEGNLRACEAGSNGIFLLLFSLD